MGISSRDLYPRPYVPFSSGVALVITRIGERDVGEFTLNYRHFEDKELVLDYLIEFGYLETELIDDTLRNGLKLQQVRLTGKGRRLYQRIQEVIREEIVSVDELVGDAVVSAVDNS